MGGGYSIIFIQPPAGLKAAAGGCIFFVTAFVILLSIVAARAGKEFERCLSITHCNGIPLFALYISVKN